MKTYKVSYDTRRIREDMHLRGWNAKLLAQASGRSPQAISYFLNGRRQTATTAARIALAFGYPIKRYLIPKHQERVA